MSDETITAPEHQMGDGNPLAAPKKPKVKPTCTIWPSSPQARESIAQAHPPGQPAYPFPQLQVGQSFTLPADSASKASLDTMCSLLGPYLQMRFRVIVHKDLALIEVARVA